MSEIDWCHCVPSAGSQRGWTLDPLLGLWVCSTCRNPSKATYDAAFLEDRFNMDEDTCATCGYPAWWTDNDCEACAMSWAEAMSEVHGRMQA